MRGTAPLLTYFPSPMHGRRERGERLLQLLLQSTICNRSASVAAGRACGAQPRYLLFPLARTRERGQGVRASLHLLWQRTAAPGSRETGACALLNKGISLLRERPKGFPIIVAAAHALPAATPHWGDRIVAPAFTLPSATPHRGDRASGPSVHPCILLVERAGG